MNIADQLFNLAVVQPGYNLVIGLYTTLGQNQPVTTALAIGILAAIIFLPLMITGYFDQIRTQQLQSQIEAIQTNEPDVEKQQEQIMKLLRKKQIRFQSESIFLAGLAAILAYLFPVFSQYWQELHPDLLYNFVTAPTDFSHSIGSINLGYSSPSLSLIPAILLFFELRQSYKAQQFLTSFIDRWYAVILPLFIYFLIFWLPSALSIILAAALGVSLYIRFLLQFFAGMRQKKSVA